MNLFTSDIDWAPEEVIADTIELFNQYKVKCTFFCTHQSNVIDSIKSDTNYELGIHPNFLPLMNQKTGSIDEVMEKILEIVPNAKGVRSHSLVQSTPLLHTFEKFGLKYEANTLLPYFNTINPYKLWNGLIKVIHNFEDDVHFMFKYPFNEYKINLFTNTLNVFCIHPIHIYLNTDSQQTYQLAKVHYKNPKELQKYRNTKVPGTRDMLMHLLSKHKEYFDDSLTVFQYLQKINLLN